MEIDPTQSLALATTAAQQSVATPPAGKAATQAAQNVAASPTPQQLRRHQQLVKATQDFEAIFIGSMLKQIHKSMAGDKPLFGASQEAKMYQDMMDDAIAQQMSHTGSFGLANVLTKSLDRNGAASAAATAAPQSDPKAIDTNIDTNTGAK
jgi:Rod binding domain-containing protein